MRLLIVVGLAATLLAACASDPTIGLTFDPCQPLALDTTGLTDAQRASVVDAIALWRMRGLDAPTLDPAPGMASVPVFFKSAAATFHGYYDDSAGAIYINTDLANPETRAITVAHELGHAFGLVHVPLAVRPSVMNPDNQTVEPTVADGGSITALWGACPR